MTGPITRLGVAIVLALAGASSLAAQQLAGSAAPGSPPSVERLSALVDSAIAADLLSRGVPGVSVMVTRGDAVLLQRAWGKADASSGRAADASTVYPIGSVTKQFTAAMVLRLVERGRLTLGDALGKHLERLRPEWGDITIEQLLNHSSGVQRGGFVDMNRLEEPVSYDTMLARIAKNELAAPPGTTYIYSNAGYTILGALVEKLYGKPYAAVLRDEFSHPLGLTSLRYCADAEPGTVATGYQRGDDGTLFPAPKLHASQMLGAGGICSTAGDLAKWNRALHGGRVLSPATYRAMTTVTGPNKIYGLGIRMSRVAWGDSIIEHGGVEPSGYIAMNAWYPADSLSVTILYNSIPVVPPGTTLSLAALALGETPPAAPTPAATAAIAGTPATGLSAEEARRQFVGEYQLGSRTFKVAFENGAFVLTPPGGEPTPMVHQSGATYVVGDASGPKVTFLADDEGTVVGFLAQAPNAPDRRLRKVR